jgi:hypothetical protein
MDEPVHDGFYDTNVFADDLSIAMDWSPIYSITLIAHSILAHLATSIPESSTSPMPVASVAMPLDDQSAARSVARSQRCAE